MAPPRLSRRDHAFLAERLAFWRPDQTVEELTRFLEQLSDDKYWEVFRQVFKANTAHNLTYASLILAHSGWFIDFEFPAASATDIARLTEDGHEEEAFAFLEKYFESRRPAIESELLARFPSRQKILRTGFRLHDDGAYEASVPLFLIQADGICRDIYGAELFRRGPMAVEKKVKQKSVDWIWEAASTPLRSVLSLAMHDTPGIGKFNRHLVLHGRSVDYGTKQNGLRAMSLLSYLQGMAAYEEEKRSPVNS